MAIPHQGKAVLKLFLNSSLFGGIPAIILGFYEINLINNLFYNNFPKIALFLKNHPIMMVGFTAIWPAIGANLEIFSKKHIPLNEQGLLTFLETLERPVQTKLDRFSRKATALLDHNNKSISKQKFFCELTRPFKQIGAIVEAIYSYYKAIDNMGTSFKVVIFFVDNEKILERPLFYYPRDKRPSTPIELLQDEKSTVMTAIKKRKMIVVDDTSKSGANFVTEDDEKREGSIICYPVIIPGFNRVRLVISKVEDKSKYFSIKNKKIYEFVLRPFSRRLIVEYCLWLMREHVKCTN